MDAVEWFQVLGLGVSFGLIGQGARVVIGLKKVDDVAGAPGATKTAGEMFDTGRLMVSLMIGAIAGALAAATTTSTFDLKAIPLSLLMGFAAAGYTGSDFIEGIMKRYLPNGGATTTTTTPASANDGAVG